MLLPQLQTVEEVKQGREEGNDEKGNARGRRDHVTSQRQPAEDKPEELETMKTAEEENEGSKR